MKSKSRSLPQNIHCSWISFFWDFHLCFTAKLWPNHLVRDLTISQGVRDCDVFVPNTLTLVALNRRFWIENRAIQNRAIRIMQFQGRFKHWKGAIQMAILNRFSAILLYCDSTRFSACRCGISGDSRPAILGIVRFAIRDSVPLRVSPQNFRGINFKCHYPWTLPKHCLGDELGNPLALYGIVSAENVFRVDCRSSVIKWHKHARRVRWC